MPFLLQCVLFCVFVIVLTRFYIGYVVLFIIPFGLVLDPARFALFCSLFAVYLYLSRRGVFKKRAWTFARCGIALWGIGFLSAFHMYFFGDLSQCRKDFKMRSREIAPVLTSSICSGNRLYLGEWNECHEDLGTTHTLFVDGKTGSIFLPHMGSRKQVPVCVFKQSRPADHRLIHARGSVHHFAADEKKRFLYLPLMSGNKVYVASMDSLKIIETLKPTVNSSLIDVAVDETRDELFILSEYSEVMKISLKTGKLRRLNLQPLKLGSLYAISLNKKTHRVYVSSWFGGYVVKIHGGAMKVEKVKHESVSVMGLSLDEKNNVVYAALPFASKIAALDASTLKVIRYYPAGLGVRDIAFLENANLLMAGNYLRRTVDFADVKTGKKIKSYYVGPMVRGVYYDAKRFEAYSVCRCGIYRFNVKAFSSVP